VQGQIVSIAGTNRHNMCGVMGSYEAGTSLTVDGQAWSTDPWIQAGVIGRVGVGSAITTVNANGILAGLAAMSNTASFVAQNGTYCGLYVGSWAGATDSEYGIYAQGGAVSSAFQAGEQASVTGSGVVLDATYSSALSVFAEDGNAAIGSGTLTRAGRFRNLQVYTAGNREQESSGLIGQLVSVAGTNRHNMAGLFGSYEAATSLTVDGQSAATDTWAQAAVIGRVGVGSAITTINAHGVLAGFAAMSNTASFVANNGAFAAFYAGAWSGATDWQYGLLLESGKVDIGIKMTPENQSIDSVVSALGATAIGNSFYVTVSAPNNQSGMSAYFDATINGSTAGHCYGLGSWINTGPTSPVLSAGHIIVPFEGGVYTGEAQTNARVVFGGQHQAILTGAPASLHCWRLNTTQTVTALIAAANPGSVGYSAGVAAGTAIGWLPLAEIVGPGVVYVKLYSAIG